MNKYAAGKRTIDAIDCGVVSVTSKKVKLTQREGRKTQRQLNESAVFDCDVLRSLILSFLMPLISDIHCPWEARRIGGDNCVRAYWQYWDPCYAPTPTFESVLSANCPNEMRSFIDVADVGNWALEATKHVHQLMATKNVDIFTMVLDACLDEMVNTVPPEAQHNPQYFPQLEEFICGAFHLLSNQEYMDWDSFQELFNKVYIKYELNYNRRFGIRYFMCQALQHSPSTVALLLDHEFCFLRKDIRRYVPNDPSNSTYRVLLEYKKNGHVIYI